MLFSRALVAAVVVSLPVAGCGDDSSTVTTSGAAIDPTTTTTMTTTGGTGEGDPDDVPTDDGGALCAALDPWLASQNDMAPAPTAAEVGMALLASAESFDRDVMPVVPDAVVGDAKALMAAYRAAGDALVAYPGTDTPIDHVNVPEMEELLAISTPQGRVANSLDSDESTSAMYYPNLFSAWMDEPCGPKALRTEVYEQYTSIATEI